jgi:hypothetical protein
LTVPELTCTASIKLNTRLSLCRRWHSLSIGIPDIARRPDVPEQSRYDEPINWKAIPLMTSAEAKLAAIAEAFGHIPGFDSECADFFYRCRHLVKVPEDGHQEPPYVAEFDELDEASWKVLSRIRERDGENIFAEVAERLIDSIKLDVEIAQGKHDHVRSIIDLQVGRTMVSSVVDCG